jgi:hypothetical protein
MNKIQFWVMGIGLCAVLVFIIGAITFTPQTQSTVSASTNGTDYFSLSCTTLRQMINDDIAQGKAWPWGNSSYNWATLENQNALVLTQIMQIDHCGASVP